MDEHIAHRVKTSELGGIQLSLQKTETTERKRMCLLE